jgi:hypothetical protein
LRSVYQDIGPCHVSGIFLPLRVNSLPLATIYEVKIPLRKWKISLLQRNPAQMTWHIVSSARDSLSMLGESRTGARARASPSMLSECLAPYGTSLAEQNICLLVLNIFAYNFLTLAGQSVHFLCPQPHLG